MVPKNPNWSSATNQGKDVRTEGKNSTTDAQCSVFNQENTDKATHLSKARNKASVQSGMYSWCSMDGTHSIKSKFGTNLQWKTHLKRPLLNTKANTGKVEYFPRRTWSMCAAEETVGEFHPQTPTGRAEEPEPYQTPAKQNKMATMARSCFLTRRVTTNTKRVKSWHMKHRNSRTFTSPFLLDTMTTTPLGCHLITRGIWKQKDTSQNIRCTNQYVGVFFVCVCVCFFFFFFFLGGGGEFWKQNSHQFSIRDMRRFLVFIIQSQRSIFTSNQHLLLRRTSSFTNYPACEKKKHITCRNILGVENRVRGRMLMKNEVFSPFSGMVVTANLWIWKNEIRNCTTLWWETNLILTSSVRESFLYMKWELSYPVACDLIQTHVHVHFACRGCCLFHRVDLMGVAAAAKEIRFLFNPLCSKEQTEIKSSSLALRSVPECKTQRIRFCP